MGSGAARQCNLQLVSSLVQVASRVPAIDAALAVRRSASSISPSSIAHLIALRRLSSLGLQPIQPLHLPPSLQLLLRRLGHGQVILGVSLVDRPGLPALLQPLE